MGYPGRITAIKDLPSKNVPAGSLKLAMKFHEDGVKTTAPARPATPCALEMPDYFQAALKVIKAAHKVFEAGSPSFKREYMAWLEEAKTEPTRLRRMAQALESLAEGKGRNWNYASC